MNFRFKSETVYGNERIFLLKCDHPRVQKINLKISIFVVAFLGEISLQIKYYFGYFNVRFNSNYPINSFH